MSVKKEDVFDDDQHRSVSVVKPSKLSLFLSCLVRRVLSRIVDV